MHLLIAESSSQSSDFLCSFLEEEGHSVHCASNGNEALSLFNKNPIDGVFSSIMLPKIGGLELLKEFRRINSFLPFVVTASHSSASGIYDAFDLGACDFLTKPIQSDALKRVLVRMALLQERFCFTAYNLQHSIGESRTLEAKNDFEEIRHWVAFITRDIAAYGVIEESECFMMQLVLQEALENAIFHGNLELSREQISEYGDSLFEEAKQRRKEDPYVNRRIVIHYKIDRNTFKYVIRDEGKGFDVDQLPDVRDPDNLFKLSGRGIALIMGFMDEVFWNDRGNEITMICYRKRKK